MDDKRKPEILEQAIRMKGEVNYMKDMNSGYNGYSMSNRALFAYANNEKPLSKWKKSDILQAISDSGIAYTFSIELLKKLKAADLKKLVLRQSSWHHTSMYCTKTDFYSLDEVSIEELTDEKIKELMLTKQKITKLDNKKYKGSIEYIEWSGTRSHPKPEAKKIENIFIEEKGCFFIITNEKNEVILKKKIGSNGTLVTNYEEERKKEKKRKEKEQMKFQKSSKAAINFYNKIKDNCVYSNSGHIYKRGRKPSGRDYNFGLEKFFKVGENRLYEDFSGVLYLETWNGSEWIEE